MSKGRARTQSQAQPAFLYRVGHSRRVLPSNADNGGRNSKHAQLYLDRLFKLRFSLPNVHVLDRVVDIPTIVTGFQVRLREAAQDTAQNLNDFEGDDVQEDKDVLRKKHRRAQIGIAGLNLARSCYETMVTTMEELILRVVLAEQSSVEDLVKAVEELRDSTASKKKEHEEEREKSGGSERRRHRKVARTKGTGDSKNGGSRTSRKH